MNSYIEEVKKMIEEEHTRQIKQPIFSRVEIVYEFWRYWLYKRIFTDWFTYSFIWRNYWEIKRDLIRFNANNIE